MNWPPLYLRRTRACLIMFYKIIHHTVAIYPKNNLLIPTDYRMRNSNFYSYRHFGTSKDFYKYSFYPRTVGQWNMLPPVAHQATTVDSFKAIVTVPLLLSAISN